MLRVARSSGDCSATVRFEEARTADGRPYEDETVALEALQPHPTRGQPTRGAAAAQDGARGGAAKQPRPSSSSAASSSAAADDDDSDDSDAERPAKVAKQQRRQQAAAGRGVGSSARGRGGGVSSPAAAAAAVATPPIAAEAAGRSPRRKRGRGEAEDAAAAKGGEGGSATKLPKGGRLTEAKPPKAFTPGLRGAAGHAATAARGTPTARPTAPHGRAPATSNGAVSLRRSWPTPACRGVLGAGPYMAWRRACLAQGVLGA